MKTTKSRHSLPFLLLATLAGLSACTSPVGPTAGNTTGVASLIVNVQSPSDGARTITPTGLAALAKDFVITLTRASYSPISVERTTLTGVAIPNVPVGTWNVGVVALDNTVASNGKQIASGSNSVILTENVTSNVTVPLYPDQATGNGSATITFTVPEIVGITSVEGYLDGTAIAAGQFTTTTPNGAITQVAYSNTLPAGFPTLQVFFKKGAVVMAPYSEVMWIYNNIPTVKTIALATTDFGSPPAAPASLAVTTLPHNDGTMKLAWPDTSNTEEAYVVERSADGSAGSYSQIGSDLTFNSTAYTDSSALQKATATYYRVSAKNYFGSSAYTVSSATFTQDQVSVFLDTNALTVGYNQTNAPAPDPAAPDSASSVTRNVTLTTTGTGGSGFNSTITWASTLPAVISTSGGVTRQPAADATVTLTATITRGTQVRTKVFSSIIVKRKTDLACVADDKAALAIGYAAISNPNYPVADSATTITRSLTLPATAVTNGTTVTWAAFLADGVTSTSIVSGTGVVTRPIVDTAITLIATISKSATSAPVGVTDTKTFSLTVLKSDDQCTVDDLAACSITYVPTDAGNGPDSATSVTRSIGLATSNLNGSTVTWSSNNTTTVSIAGATGSVTRQPTSTDTAVNITATAVRRLVTRTRTFPLTVIRKTNAACVAADLATVGLTYSGVSYLDPSAGPAIAALAAVKANLTPLPATPSNQSTITWAWARMSGGTDGSVSAAGVVTRPIEVDTVGTFTATVTKSTGDGASATSTKTFLMTVTFPAGSLAVTITLSDPSAATVTFSGNSATIAKGASWTLSTLFSGATSQKWYLDGAPAGTPTSTAATYVMSSASMYYGLHNLTLIVLKNGISYSGSIAFTVTQ